jgi:hypothetical protein
MTDQQQQMLWAGFGAVCLVVVVWLVVRKKRADAYGAASAGAPRIEELALIEETVAFTNSGMVAAALLAVTNLLMVITFFRVKGAMQQAAVGTVWTAGNVLWGACMLVGRERTYRVIRQLRPDQPSQPPRV